MSPMHMVLQDVPPQTYWSQLFTVASGQLPLPSQARALVCIPPEQEAGFPHAVPEATCWHFLPAAQLPVLPHSPFDAHRLCGSGSPAETAVQVPGVDPLQVSQVPHEAEWQQTPSTQVPLAHGAPVPQESPNPPPLLHMPDERQIALVPQSLLPVQARQPAVLLASQTRFPHATGVGEGQVVPVPEQKAAGMKLDPLHLAGAHIAVDVWQTPPAAPAPPQEVVLPHGVVAAQRLSVVPDPVAQQLPSWPLTLHLLQAPQLASPQQTPSTQLPLVH